MTTTTDIVNRALQQIGTRTTVTSTEMTNQTTNEAIQANLVLTQVRDELLRMAPWNCAGNYANLTLITAVPGTPENTTSGAALWAKGIPAPPWTYEYQYPVDCLDAIFIVPGFTTGFSGGVPITTAVTGGSPSFWQGPPVLFKVGVDQFVPVTAATVAVGGTGHAVGDIITLESGATDEDPIGAPAQLLVATVAAGVILTVTVVNQIAGSATPQGGSYFAQQTNPVAQGSTTGSGIDATFTLTYGTKGSQRVILTNQESATLFYCLQVTDPNVMDPNFIQAWVSALGGRLAMALSGDKALANLNLQLANKYVMDARQNDGNEGLTVNDVTPDWIRVRGIDFAGDCAWGGPYSGWQWGSTFNLY